MPSEALLHLDDGRLLLADGELVAAHGNLDGIAQRRDLHDLELRTLDEPEVHQVPTQRTGAVQLDDGGAIPHRDISQCLHDLPPFSILTTDRDAMRHGCRFYQTGIRSNP